MVAGKLRCVIFHQKCNHSIEYNHLTSGMVQAWVSQKLVKRDILLELYTGVGISVGIGWYFVGIIPTNTNGKLGW